MFVVIENPIYAHILDTQTQLNEFCNNIILIQSYHTIPKLIIKAFFTTRYTKRNFMNTSM